MDTGLRCGVFGRQPPRKPGMASRLRADAMRRAAADLNLITLKNGGSGHSKATTARGSGSSSEMQTIPEAPEETS